MYQRHPADDMAERGIARVLVRRIEIAAVADDDEEVARRRAEIVARHRERAVDMVEARRAGRLMLHGLEHPRHVVGDAALHQPLAVPGSHRTVEGRAVEAVLIDISEEIGTGDRRPRIERDDDGALIGLDADARRRRMRRSAPRARCHEESGKGGDEHPASHADAHRRFAPARASHFEHVADTL